MSASKDEESKQPQEEQPEQQEPAAGTSPTVRVAETAQLPLGWTQLGGDSATAAERIRYPHDAAEIDPNDDEIVIVGTAGQKITHIGPDFSSKVENAKNLKQLVLRSHLIHTMEGLEGFENLELLELYDNQVDALACLADDKGAPGKTLRVLDMSYNAIRDMAPVALCPNLQELYIANNKLKTIAGLKHLVHLRKIDLGANRIRVMDPDELGGLVNLEELWIGKNKIEQIQGLENLKKLRRLDIQSNRLAVVENLQSQTETLEELYLAHNGITTEGAFHVTGLAQNFTVLSVVDLSRNRLTNANSFSHLKTLEELWLSGNKIATFDDIAALKVLPQLDTIYLEYNPIQEDPLYRKKVKETIPCLKQIDATLIGGLAAHGMPSTSPSPGPPETDAQRARRLQDEAIQRAQAESAKRAGSGSGNE